ncbi:MAG: response regulator [Nitrosopumilus sp.]
MNILGIDDNEDILKLLKTVLTSKGHDFTQALNGKDGIKLIEEQNFDVILLDLAMPKKDGLTVVKEIIQFDPDAKIILITASDNQKIIQECIDSGAKSYISKPFDFKGILKAITEILAK